MSKCPDLFGKTFGYLKVISHRLVDPSTNEPYHNVKCHGCKKHFRLIPWQITKSGRSSCGCQQGVHKGGRVWADPKDSRRWTTYHTNAKKTNRKWALSRQQFATLIHAPCHYHGCHTEALGIDRVNNLGHYTIDNCVPCCERCNCMKGELTYDEFLYQIRLISDCRLSPQISPIVA